MRWRALRAGLALAALACGPDLAAEKQQEIEKLKAERVERVAVEKATGELAEVEARIAQAKEALAAKQAALAPLERSRDTLRAAAASERAKLPALAAAQAEALAEAKQALETAQQLDQRIERMQVRALRARDQMTLLVREIRPGDAAWATERRLATLREIVARFHTEWGDDPVLKDSAAELMAVTRPEVPPEKGREVASRVAARLTRIYALPESGAAASPDGAKSQ
jgi:hypothetical protein